MVTGFASVATGHGFDSHWGFLILAMERTIYPRIIYPLKGDLLISKKTSYTENFQKLSKTRQKLGFTTGEAFRLPFLDFSGANSSGF